MNVNPNMRPVAAEEVERSFDGQVAAFDAFRGDSLLSLLRLREVKAAQSERQYENARKEYGADDPRTQQFATELALNRRFTGELGAEADRAGATAPNVDARSWMLYGYVRDTDLQGLEGLRVALYDAQGHWVEALGHACTDEHGYFEIRASVGDTHTRVADFKLQFFLRVVGPDQESLYADRSATVPEAGVALYREIILDGSKPCLPPSEVAVALPEQDPTRPPNTVRDSGETTKRTVRKKRSK
jgi:hypothetical protein